jgi:hypothetical protein
MIVINWLFFSIFTNETVTGTVKNILGVCV